MTSELKNFNIWWFVPFGLASRLINRCFYGFFTVSIVERYLFKIIIFIYQYIGYKYIGGCCASHYKPQDAQTVISSKSWQFQRDHNHNMYFFLSLPDCQEEFGETAGYQRMVPHKMVRLNLRNNGIVSKCYFQLGKRPEEMEAELIVDYINDHEA